MNTNINTDSNKCMLNNITDVVLTPYDMFNEIDSKTTNSKVALVAKVALGILCVAYSLLVIPLLFLAYRLISNCCNCTSENQITDPESGSVNSDEEISRRNKKTDPDVEYTMDKMLSAIVLNNEIKKMI